ncbi:geraniol 8-hydroxylase-like [Quercus robur]|uniref:geraniol 8-hydroxylase-like n=1 Tax=Quercus robur TaxID=38942 RepID=UPI002162B2B8|nr:geraniol 8-hydroxylase-like [Quercus robur]
MDFWIFVICLCLSWTIIQALHSIPRRSTAIPSKLPPGPKSFPIIGNVFELGDKPHKMLAKLANTHGPLMSLKLGQITTVVISSAAMAREALQTHDQVFSNRTIPNCIHAHKHQEFGLPWMPVSTRWRNLRKICNSELFSSKILDANQNLRRKKVQELLTDIHKSSLAGDAVDIGRAAFKISLNLLSNTIFSMDLAIPNSDTARVYKQIVSSIMEEAGKPNLGDYFPILRKFDIQGIRQRMTIHFGKMIDVYDNIISQRLKLRKVPGFISNKDVLDTLLNISEDNRAEIDKNQIKHFLLDLFSAGTDTTSSTLQWAMAELLHNPEILSKAGEELRQTIGRGNTVEESDIPKLPYLQAIIKETFRLHPAVPLLLPRKAEADVEVKGFTVPKGAQVLVNAWAIGRDPSIWDNPNSFMPERFLGSEIDVRGHNFELIPFGGGRRICPGLSLAIRMVHLMLGSLIHSFDWKLEDGITPEDMNLEDKFGLTLDMAQPLQAIPITF